MERIGSVRLKEILSVAAMAGVNEENSVAVLAVESQTRRKYRKIIFLMRQGGLAWRLLMVLAKDMSIGSIDWDTCYRKFGTCRSILLVSFHFQVTG